MFDIRPGMSMMRMGAGQFGDVRMFHRVVPQDLLPGLVNLVAVIANEPRVQVYEFPHIQRVIPLKGHLTIQLGQCRANASQDQCGVADARVLRRKC